MRIRKSCKVRLPWAHLVVLALCVLVSLSGCKLTPSRDKSGGALISPGEDPGKVVEAKRCSLTVVIITRPQGDPLVDEVAWSLADEQVVEPDLRRAWQTNGLRIGRLTGELPSRLSEQLRAKPPNQPEIQMIANASGDSALVDANQRPPQPAINLLLSDPQGQVRGKNYTDAKGLLRVTATHEGPNAVSLKIAPELHHGPVQSNFVPLPTGGLMMPREFQLSAGQKQETMRELAASITLHPGQIAVIGTRADRTGSLGDLLFNKPEGNSDRIKQSLILIWANRNGVSDAGTGSFELPPALMPLSDETLKEAVGPQPVAQTSTESTASPSAIQGQDVVPALAGDSESTESAPPTSSESNSTNPTGETPES